LVIIPFFKHNAEKTTNNGREAVQTSIYLLLIDLLHKSGEITSLSGAMINTIDNIDRLNMGASILQKEQHLFLSQRNEATAQCVGPGPWKTRHSSLLPLSLPWLHG
jgi:hypothetical protein